ncbi:unnamed protein product [Lactuca saligna]|uniref:Uncharacterized protein n=1 Tax=Lactuca saligna TaxID=75948 RepID=A0AA35YKX5_LACSI|nr:unnamed protein product [Lactuca saligna]
MYAYVSEASNIIEEFKKLPASGPRELTPAMILSIEEADKPAKRGKKQDNIKGAKGKTPKKRKTEKATPSQPKQKKIKKPARRLILQSLSDSESDYVPIGHNRPSPTASESESSGEEVSVRGDTPPRSPTPEALFSSAVKEHDTSISNAVKAIDASTSQCHKGSLAVETSTKECKEVTTKVEKLISEAQIFLDSLQVAAQKMLTP